MDRRKEKMVKKKKPNPVDSPLMNFFTKPWFVLGVMVVCFGILTPKIFLPLFRQLLGYSRSSSNAEANSPTDRNRFRPPPPIPQPQAAVDPENFRTSARYDARPNPGFGHQHGGGGGGGGGRSFLTFLLPVYAIGIGLYMAYTLFKVFNKKEEKQEEDNSSDDEDKMRPRTVRFKENDFITSNLAWDAVNGEFKMKRGDAHFAKSEESEDELNDYANYRNLDPDYVRYLKEIRRAKRRSQQQQQQKQQQQQQQQYRRSQEQTVEEEDEYEYEEEQEEEEEEAIPVPIPLTPNIGITSITNTNVLMNDTLERMKHSLNRINSQIMEKKGAGLEGEELEDLHFQLAQTEYQMAKILKIVNSAADSFNASMLLPPPPPSAIYQRNGVNYDDSDSEEDEDEIQERIEYEEETEIVETTKYVKANRSSSSNSSNSSSSASLSSISSSPFNRSSSDGTKQTTRKSNSETKTTLNNDSNKPMLSEESLRKRRLKKKNNRKRAKLNKKNKNKADFESKKEA